MLDKKLFRSQNQSALHPQLKCTEMYVEFGARATLGGKMRCALVHGPLSFYGSRQTEAVPLFDVSGDFPVARPASEADE